MARMFGIFIGGPVRFIGIVIIIAALAFGVITKRTQEAVEKMAELNQKQNDELKRKELWVAERMNALTSEGLSISDAKAKVDMGYTLNKNRVK